MAQRRLSNKTSSTYWNRLAQAKEVGGDYLEYVKDFYARKKELRSKKVRTFLEDTPLEYAEYRQEVYTYKSTPNELINAQLGFRASENYIKVAESLQERGINITYEQLATHTAPKTFWNRIREEYERIKEQGLNSTKAINLAVDIVFYGREGE